MASSVFIYNSTDPPEATYKINDTVNYIIKVGNPSQETVKLKIKNKLPDENVVDLGEVTLNPFGEEANYYVKSYTISYKVTQNDVAKKEIINVVYVNGSDSNGDIIDAYASKPSTVIEQSDSRGGNPGNSGGGTTIVTPIIPPPTIEKPPVIELPKKEERVTPPPSEKVTPPWIKITPEIVPAGDPTITVIPQEKLKTIYAITPEGRQLYLKYYPKTNVWKRSFLVPFGTKDGAYVVKIFTVNRHNMTSQYNYTIKIDNSIPLIYIMPVKKYKNKLLIESKVLFPATRVTATFFGKPTKLQQKSFDEWNETITIPKKLHNGTYLISVLAKDNLGHSAKAAIKWNYKK